MNSGLVSVILPTYNEKDNIIDLIQAVHRELKDQSYEIIVVDDQSPDGTYQTVCELQDEKVKTVLRTADPGLAESIRCGLEQAQGDIILVMDSDFDHDPQYIPFMLKALEHYDFVCASRFLYGGKMNGWLHSLGSRAFNIFIQCLTQSRLTDHLYGYFMIKREVLEQCPYDKIFYGYGDYYIRLLYYLEKCKVSIRQFPVVNGARVRQKETSFLEIFVQYFMAVIRLPEVLHEESHV